jgi:hypothetical protein
MAQRDIELSADGTNLRSADTRTSGDWSAPICWRAFARSLTLTDGAG